MAKDINTEHLGGLSGFKKLLLQSQEFSIDISPTVCISPDLYYFCVKSFMLCIGNLLNSVSRYYYISTSDFLPFLK